MKKLLILLVLLLVSYMSFSQGLNEDYTTVYDKVKKGEEFRDMTFNTDKERKWINAYSSIGWNSYGFPLHGNVCDVVIFVPFNNEGASAMIQYCNANLIIIDAHNWNFYREDNSAGRVTLKSVDGNLTFYFYNL